MCRCLLTASDPAVWGAVGLAAAAAIYYNYFSTPDAEAKTNKSMHDAEGRAKAFGSEAEGKAKQLAYQAEGKVR